MIKTYTVDKRQTLIDACLQLYGSTQFLFKLAKDNSLNIDSDVSLGDILIYDTAFGNEEVKVKTLEGGFKYGNFVEEVQ